MKNFNLKTHIVFNKIKCFIGLHDWETTIPSERICKRCNKQQARVCYPFESSSVYWENL